jgi:hypothetical protein
MKQYILGRISAWQAGPSQDDASLVLLEIA